MALLAKNNRSRGENVNTQTAGNIMFQVPHLHLLCASPLVQEAENHKYAKMVSLKIDQEREAILNALDSTGREINFSFDVATPRTLSEAFHVGCHVLHYCGHGTDGGIVLEKSVRDIVEGTFDLFKTYGMAQQYTPAQVRDLAEKARTDESVPIQCVVVNACKSEVIGHAFLDTGVPFVICVDKDVRIKDNLAQSFSKDFYSLLFSGQTVQSAFNFAEHNFQQSLTSRHKPEIKTGLRLLFNNDPKVVALHKIFYLATRADASDEPMAESDSNCELDTSSDAVMAETSQSKSSEVVSLSTGTPASAPESMLTTSSSIKPLSATRKRTSEGEPGDPKRHQGLVASDPLPPRRRSPHSAQSLAMATPQELPSANAVLYASSAASAPFTSPVATAVAEQPGIPIPCGNVIQCSRSQLAPHNLPRFDMSSIIGRHGSICELLRKLAMHHVVAVQGAIGLGKSTVALAAAWYLRERGGFSDGILRISFRSSTNVATMYDAIESALSSIDISLDVTEKESGEEGKSLKGLKPEDMRDKIGHVLGNRSVLLVLLHCEQLLASKDPSISHELIGFLSTLINKSSSHVRVIMCSTFHVPDIPGKGVSEPIEHMVTHLPHTEMTELFISLAKERFNRDDVRGQMTESSPVLSFIAGNPLLASLCVNLLERNTSFKEVEDRLSSEGHLALNNFDARLKYSLESTIQRLDESEPDAVFMFALMSLFPNGILTPVGETYRGKLLGSGRGTYSHDGRQPFDLATLFESVFITEPLKRSQIMSGRKPSPKYTQHLRTLRNHALVYTREVLHGSISLDRTYPFHAEIASELFNNDKHWDRLALFLPAFVRYNACMCEWFAWAMEIPELSSIATAILQVHEPTINKCVANLAQEAVRSKVLDSDIPVAAKESFKADINSLLTKFPLILTYKRFRVDCGIAQVQQGLGIFSALQDNKGVIEMNVQLGTLLGRRGRYPAALEQLELARQSYHDLHEREKEAKVVAKIGRVYEYQQLFEKAEQQFLEAQQLYPHPRFLQFRASLAWRQNHFDQAISLYKEVVELCTDPDTMCLKAGALRDLGKLYNLKGEFHTSRDYLEQSLAAWKECDKVLGQAFVLQQLGNLLIGQNSLSDAFRYLREAQRVFEGLGHEQGRANSMFSLGWASQCNKDYHAAIKYYQDAHRIYDVIGDLRSKCNAQVDLAQCLKEEVLGRTLSPEEISRDLVKPVELLNQVLQSDTQPHIQANALLELSSIYISQGRGIESKNLMDKVANLRLRDRDEAYKYIIEAAIKRHWTDPDGAREKCEQAEALLARWPNAYYQRRLAVEWQALNAMAENEADECLVDEYIA